MNIKLLIAFVWPLLIIGTAHAQEGYPVCEYGKTVYYPTWQYAEDHKGYGATHGVCPQDMPAPEPTPAPTPEPVVAPHTAEVPRTSAPVQTPVAETPEPEPTEPATIITVHELEPTYDPQQPNSIKTDRLNVVTSTPENTI